MQVAWWIMLQIDAILNVIIYKNSWSWNNIAAQTAAERLADGKIWFDSGSCQN